ncbi:MAG: rod shape-determining protein MreC [Eubacteriales bacterium]|nr:rod shape-determining protein MreC [Eubacteriales bacterium]
MKFFEKNKKLFITLLTVICIILALLTVNRTNPSLIEKGLGFVLSPIQNFTTSVTAWFEEKFNALSNFKNLEEENEILKMELELKDQEIKRLKQLEIENEKLSSLLETSSKYNEYSKIAANIIAKDPGNWYENFIIDKGEKDGLKKNMVVLSVGGLVGKIEEVGPNYAKVSSIINGTYSVSAKTLRTDDEGFVRGDLSDKGICKMEYIDKEAEIKEGDEIVTSHLSEIYPAGITIGYVKEVYLDDNNKLSKTAIIEPTVDFKHLENVLVINSIKN